MARNLWPGVFGIVHGIAHQPSYVLVLQPVEDLGPFTPGPHQPGHPQLGQVLRHRRRRLGNPVSQVIDRQLLIHQLPQQSYPGAIRQHPEHLNG